MKKNEKDLSQRVQQQQTKKKGKNDGIKKMTVHASKVIGVLLFTTALLISFRNALSFSVGGAVSHILRWRSMMKHTSTENNNFRYNGASQKGKAANKYTQGMEREESSSHVGGGSQKQKYRPIPVMPSQLFQQLALSQLELLANSLQVEGESSSSSSADNNDSSSSYSSSSFSSSSSKVKSMALYLPQENPKTGQLEFTPVVLYPPLDRDRVFIAPEAASGIPPTLPRTLTKLPGFSHARTLLPGYPMVSSSSSSSSSSGAAATYIPAGIGMVEEVLCDLSGSNACALSVPLFSASQTVGVLLVSPSVKPPSTDKNQSVWSRRDREQIAKAAESLSLALCMDQERASLQNQSESIKEALSNSLHQVKNPLQALRTYGKLLQRRIADTTSQAVDGGTSSRTSTSFSSFDAAANKNQQLLELANHLMVQSDRLTERLQPVDVIIDSMGCQSLLSNNRLLPPVARSNSSSNNMTKKKNENKKKEEPYLLLPYRALAVTPPASTSTSVDPGRWTTPFLPPSDDSKENIPAKTGLSSGDTPTTRTTRRRRYVNRGIVQSAIQGDDIRRFSSNEPRTMSGTRMFENSAGVSSSSSTPPLEMAFAPDVLEPIFNGFYAIALDKGISFVVNQEQGNDNDDDNDELPGVYMNVQSLQEAVSNVLDNAFKYVVLPKPKSPFLRNPSPKVHVQLKSSTDDSSVIILVQDNGPGIPHELQEEIFQRGYRAPTATDSGIAGTGLGLSIARSLMQEMGGSLQLVVDASPSSPRTRTAASNSKINKRRRLDSDKVSRKGKDSNLLDGTVMKFVLYRKPVMSGAVNQ